ncbi:hypothetical protein [Streptomyces sp. Ag109_O5-1]|uniref:hypothetical protein n=1 Tax=Streptomyces sp. Ag109_O5-1 TaxID=1938851 RepID=UPI0021A574F1|nr:hypothetical protein [Streptomyces sp. Ag109_O5-1]
MPGDEGVPVGQEEESHLGDLVRFADTADRRGAGVVEGHLAALRPETMTDALSRASSRRWPHPETPGRDRPCFWPAMNRIFIGPGTCRGLRPVRSPCATIVLVPSLPAPM